MKQRIITASILIAIFLPIAIWGGIPFSVLAFIMATIGLYEFFQMRKLSIFSFHGIVALLLLWTLLLPESVIVDIGMTKMKLVFVAVLLFLSYTVIVKNHISFEQVGVTLFSVLYVGMGFYYMIQTRDAGIVYLFYALFVVWMTDSGAYFVGRKLGKRKLWPDISPNKTIGGFIGGIISALVVAGVFAVFTNIQIPVMKLFIITILLSIFGQLGDLAESALKRHFGVKDSGNLFPGHGGILDRCDSWLFVLPLFNFLHVL
ncbi:phosphatidate cytidylyltransferase [Bacillus niameyensis]|uniref:phosphatidate cytidylyltransferase n=1 Tax=Bacillus niameyensis TaxID=1522308 RepID=UPI000781BECF|nr:phosphatidate cytidylyltransferase [Bacillus niameyensis]